MENKVNVIDWPARSLEINPIEKAWGILSCAVYKDHCQFASVDELKEAIRQAWNNISAEMFRYLASSMARRLIALVESRGRPTSY